MLKFEATIDGRPAPKCSLVKDVTWVFSNEYGGGELSDGGKRGKKRPVGRHKGNKGIDNRYCNSRTGECSFGTGVHTWKILVKSNHVYDNLFVRPVCEVGITEATDNLLRHLHTRPVCCQPGGERIATLTLDMQNSTLLVEIDDGTKENMNLPRGDGKQFWPYVSFVDNMEVVLLFD
jgi:hypothetical protein